MTHILEGDVFCACRGRGPRRSLLSRHNSADKPLSEALGGSQHWAEACLQGTHGQPRTPAGTSASAYPRRQSPALRDLFSSEPRTKGPARSMSQGISEDP